MSIVVPLSPEAELRLRRKAEAAGVDVSAFASQVLERAAREPVSLEELSGPLAEDFRQSGMSEDELTDLLEREKHAMRAERRAKQTPT